MTRLRRCDRRDIVKIRSDNVDQVYTSKGWSVRLAVDAVLLGVSRVPLEGAEDLRGYRGCGGDVGSLRDVAILAGLELDADDLAVGCRVRGRALGDDGRALGTVGLGAAGLLVAYAVARLKAVEITEAPFIILPLDTNSSD
jgi:hypothetical protein